MLAPGPPGFWLALFPRPLLFPAELNDGRFYRSLQKDAREVLRRLQIGELVELRGIEGGIENTNYFLTSTQGEFVLTLFERLTAEQLPFYLHLMKHLAHGGIPCPSPGPTNTAKSCTPWRASLRRW